jgi:hypothetical protein
MITISEMIKTMQYHGLVDIGHHKFYGRNNDLVDRYEISVS